jgi:lipopolysaccharide/colanic/teichoic acid biosynthesis glycosyltransferase
MKRVLDVILSCIAILVFSPFFIVIAILIKANSAGSVFYRQKRVGKNGAEFLMVKFRTMRENADSSGAVLTTTNTDDRITGVGRFLRRYKLDELPQFFNVLAGSMSIVGPRPEVKKYVDMYTAEQRKVLGVLPGITDFASIRYNNEAEMLAAQANPEEYYIKHIMPEKIRLNQVYLVAPTLGNYFRIIFLTILKVLSPQKN